MTLTLGGLLSQNMAVVTVFALEAVSGLLETLVRTLIGFNLRHCIKTPHC